MQRLTRKLALIVTLALLASLVLALTVGRPQQHVQDDAAVPTTVGDVSGSAADLD